MNWFKIAESQRRKRKRHVGESLEARLLLAADFRFDGLLGSAEKQTSEAPESLRLSEIGSPLSVSGRDGTPNGAYAFDGDDYLSLGNAHEVVGQTINAEFWVKTTGAMAESVIIGGTRGNGSRHFFTAGIAGVRGQQGDRIAVEIGTPSSSLYATSTSSITDGRWHHVVINVFNSPQATIEIFVDGNLEVSTNADFTFSPESYDQGWQVGALVNWQSHAIQRHFTGSIDNVTIDGVRTSDDTLTVEEVASIVLRQKITGATIITHGWQPPFGENGDSLLSLAQAVRKKADDANGVESGWLLDYDVRGPFQLDGVFDVRQSLLPHSFDATGELVLLFDWARASNELSSGWGEAAGDALFSLIVQLGLANPKEPDAPAIPLHFIGHSFGTAVTSEAVERLGAFGCKVDQVTYLDPHEFNQGLGFDGAQELFELGQPDGYGAVAWENVEFTDVYYQTRGDNTETGGDWFPVPNGRPIPGSYNVQLRDGKELPVLGTHGSGTDRWGGDHSWVWTGFYIATVQGFWPSSFPQPEKSTSVDLNSTGYALTRVARQQSGGFPDTSDPANSKFLYSSREQDHTYSPTLLTNRGRPINTTDGDFRKWEPVWNPRYIVNGDFRHDNFSGWTDHGGEYVSSFLEDSQLRLGQDGGASTAYLRHNRLFVPPSATVLQFRLNVGNSSPDDFLRVSLAGRIIAEIPIDRRFEQTELVGFPASIRGEIGILQFEILSPHSFIDSVIYLNDISFVCGDAELTRSYFFDDFDRNDGPLGNGWTSEFAGPGIPMEIQNGRAVNPNTNLGPNASSAAWMHRQLPLSDTVTIAGTLFESMGASGSGSGFGAGVQIGSNGSQVSGYGVWFGRSGTDWRDSGVFIAKDGVVLARYLSPFQFEDEIDFRFEITRTGQIVGEIREGSKTFEFTHEYALTDFEGDRLTIWTGPRDDRGNPGPLPQFDNIQVTATRAPLIDDIAPASAVEDVDLVSRSLTIPLTITAVDLTDNDGRASGVCEVEIWVAIEDREQRQSSDWELWKTIPGPGSGNTQTTIDYVAKSNRTIWFASVAIDNQGNRERFTGIPNAKTVVGDFDAPKTSVVSATADPVTGLFSVSFTGNDKGGAISAVADTFVSFDGGVPQHLGTFLIGVGQTTSTGTTLFQGIVDGLPHSYRFYTVGVDAKGNREAEPTGDGDVLISATFMPAARLEPTAIDVQRGATQRSFVRYVDMLFNDDDQQSLLDLVNGGRIRLERFAFNTTLPTPGTGTPIALNRSAFTLFQNRVQIDFGEQGIGGNRNTNAGDGFYQLIVDLDGDGTYFDSRWGFHRMFGDANGDGAANSADVTRTRSFFGQSGSNLDGDLNGDRFVNSLDILYASRESVLGKRLNSSLFDYLND